ncbi:MAG: HPP family protein [Rhodocyclaceae bacterium]|nr:MAG: HPP family protein [Rhodocyclaceae bacterium]
MHRSPFVRLLWCALGAGAGITLALKLVGPPLSPFLLASLGGSTVFLFGLTRAPAAQPRSLFVGHLGGAFIGIVCYQTLGDGLLVYAFATVLTLCLMLITKTVHPPAGANPLLMIAGHAGFSALWQPVLVGVLTLAVVAAIWSRLFPGLSHYPVAWLENSPPSTLWGGWGESPNYGELTQRGAIPQSHIIDPGEHQELQ